MKDPRLIAAFDRAYTAWQQRQDQLTIFEFVQSDSQRDGAPTYPLAVPPAPKETT